MSDPPMTKTGKTQAAAVGMRFGDRRDLHIHTSPTVRTLATASAIAEASGVRPTAWPLLAECGFLTGYPGIGRRELARRYPLVGFPETIADDGWALGYPWPEEDDSRPRAREVVTELLQTHPVSSEDEVLLVSHYAFINMLLEVMLGTARTVVYDHDNTGVSALRFDEERIRIEHLNCCRHLVLNPDS